MTVEGKLTKEGKEYLLNLGFRNTGNPVQELYLGLANSEITAETTLENIAEVTDENYERKLFNFKEPLSGPDITRLFNLEEVNFGPWLNDQNENVSAAFVSDKKTGDDGMLLIYFPVDGNLAPFKDDELSVAEDNLSFEME